MSSFRIGVAAILIGVTALVPLRASAQAEDRTLQFGPAFAGGGVVWNDWSGDPGPLALRRRTAQGSTLVSPDAHLTAASAGALVFLERTELRAGPPGGPFVPLRLRRTCRSERGMSADARGSLVAFTDCPAAGAKLVVQDVRTGHRTVLGRGVVGRRCCSQVQVAGRFVAWVQEWPLAGTVTVYDRVQKRVRYRARVSTWSFDLQEDGKIAAVVSRGPRSPWETIVWFSPAEPRAHTLRFIRSRGHAGPIARLAGDRIAAVAARGTNGYRGELVVLGLDGSRRSIARFRSVHERHHLAGGFDFDGERIVWGSKTVVDRRVVCDDWGCTTVTAGAWRIQLQDLRGKRTPRTVVSVSFHDRP